MPVYYPVLPHEEILLEAIIKNVSSRFLVIKENYKWLRMTSTDAMRQLLMETNGDLKSAMKESHTGIYTIRTQINKIDLRKDNPIFKTEAIFMKGVIERLEVLLTRSGILDGLKAKIESASSNEEVVIPMGKPSNDICFEIHIQDGKLMGHIVLEKCDMFKEAPKVLTTYVILTRAIADIVKIKATELRFAFCMPYVCVEDIELIQRRFEGKENEDSAFNFALNTDDITINRAYVLKKGTFRYEKGPEGLEAVI